MYLGTAPLSQFVLGDVQDVAEVYDLESRPPATLAELLAGPHGTRFRVTLIDRDGEQVADLTPDVRSGTVTAAAEQAPYRRLSLTMGRRDGLVPRTGSDLLHYRSGNEIKVEMGVHHHRVDRTWWATVGVFGLVDTTISSSQSGDSVTIACPDRTLRAKRSLVLRPIEVLNGLSVEDTIIKVLGQRCGDWLPIKAARTGLTLPDARVAHVGDDPWEVSEKIAKDGGARLIMDATGAALLRRIEEPRAPDVVYRVEDGKIGELTRTLDGDAYRDAVIVPWGRRKLAYLYYPDEQPWRRWTMHDGDQTIIPNEEHARRVAIADLQAAGGQESVSIQVPANPWLELGQVAQVAGYRHGLRIIGPITGFTLNLSGGDMTVQVTARKAVAG